MPRHAPSCPPLRRPVPSTSVIPDPRLKMSGAGVSNREVFANGKCSEGPSFCFFLSVMRKERTIQRMDSRQKTSGMTEGDKGRRSFPSFPTLVIGNPSFRCIVFFPFRLLASYGWIPRAHNSPAIEHRRRGMTEGDKSRPAPSCQPSSVIPAKAGIQSPPSPLRHSRLLLPSFPTFLIGNPSFSFPVLSPSFPRPFFSVPSMVRCGHDEVCTSMSARPEFVGTIHIFLGPYRGNPIGLYLRQEDGACSIAPTLSPWNRVVGAGETANKAAADFDAKWKAGELTPEMYSGPHWEGGIKPEKPKPPPKTPPAESAPAPPVTAESAPPVSAPTPAPTTSAPPSAPSPSSSTGPVTPAPSAPAPSSETDSPPAPSAPAPADSSEPSSPS